MANQSGPQPRIEKFAEGKPVSAEELKRAIDALTHRIVGDERTIQVRSFPGGQIIIGAVGGGHKSGVMATTTVKRVGKLPPIPATGMLDVFWYSGSPGADADGTGDNQVWRAYAGQTRWTPTQKGTNLSGLPIP